MPNLNFPPWITLACGIIVVSLFFWTRVPHLNYQGSGSEVVMVLASDYQRKIGDEIEYKQNVFLNRASYAYRYGYDFVWANISAFPVAHAESPHWSKARVLRAAFEAHPKAKWLWWLDLDAVIMTPTMPLSKILGPGAVGKIILPPDTKIRGSGGPTGLNISYPVKRINGWDRRTRLDEDKLQMLITQDEYHGLNTGSFFLKRGWWADWILDLWTDQSFVERGWGLREQEALLRLMLGHKLVRDGIGLVRQRAINAYFREKGEEDGQENSEEIREKGRDGLGMKWRQGDLVVHMAGCGDNGWCDKAWPKMWTARERERDEDIHGAKAKRDRGEWGIEVGLEDLNRCGESG